MVRCVHSAVSCTGSEEITIKCRHTSVVVFGKEVYYGQGIVIKEPGQSHVRLHSSLIVTVCY